MFCALETLFSIATANTTNPAEKAKQLDAIALATAYATMANQSQSCNSSALAGLQTAFWSVLSPWVKSTDCCDCCTDGDIIQARCGINATPASYTFTAQPSQYLAVTVNGTAVEYSLTSAAVALLDAIRVTTITSPDSSVTVGNVVSGTPGGTNAFTLVTPFNENHYSMLVTYTNPTLTAGTPTVRRSGNVWAAGAPTLLGIGMSGVIVLNISNLLLAGTRQLYATATIVSDTPVKARRLSSTSLPINNVVSAVALTTNGASSSVNICFFDLGSDPLLGQFVTDFSATGIGAQVVSFTLQVDIWT
jgi:hypothetical protein